MGSEAVCTATVNGKTSDGKARLEAETLEFRAPALRLSIPFKAITRVAASDGTLSVHSDAAVVSLSLGAQAEKWAAKIQRPRTRLEKIGVKAEWRVSAIDVDDEAFLRELKDRVARLSIDRVLDGSDAIFLGAATDGELGRIAKLVRALKPDGSLWVIRPKGRPEITERAVMAAGKKAGLVDVKVVSFSPTHTAEKFVIPVRNRPR